MRSPFIKYAGYGFEASPTPSPASPAAVAAAGGTCDAGGGSGGDCGVANANANAGKGGEEGVYWFAEFGARNLHVGGPIQVKRGGGRDWCPVCVRRVDVCMCTSIRSYVWMDTRLPRMYVPTHTTRNAKHIHQALESAMVESMKPWRPDQVLDVRYDAAQDEVQLRWCPEELRPPHAAHVHGSLLAEEAAGGAVMSVGGGGGGCELRWSGNLKERVG